MQIHMVENTLGQYWWDNHKAAMVDQREEERVRLLEEAERKRKNEATSDEAATLKVVKSRLGIRYYLMPWLVQSELKKIARIAAIEKDLDATMGKR
jgi:hypothetical protein